MTTALRASSFALFFLGVFGAALHAAPQSGTTTPLRYARAKSPGAKLYNLADTKGVELLTVKTDGLLAVYSESAGFLEVEPAEGMQVWVSGKYLAPSETPGVFKVTGNGINMRPSPTSASENSYPLSRSLNKSDEVRVAGRAHPEKPISEDWVHVWAPAGTHAWCRRAEVADATGADVASLFTTAQKDARAAAKLWMEPVAASTTSASAPKVADSKPEKPAVQAPTTSADLAKANELYEKACASDSSDFSAAKSAFQKVVDAAPQSSAADSARIGLEKIALHEEIVRIRNDRASLEVDREKRLAQAEKDLREASLSSDPLWGRFQTRGWLEKEGDRWVVRWAGKLASEITCSSQRYDLSLFAGYQLGITGALVRGASSDGPARFDVRRIEVLDARGTEKH
ncbi:MAG: hypothetical protein IPJ19_12370 [Planctomycetes bacterium]|nr:hypothetical protein [Planctomycetota bacterium]